MVTLNVTDDAGQAADQHLESYNTQFRACIGKLRAIWRQVGTEPDDSRSQILVASEQALAAWTHAVERAETERQSIKALIQQYSSEIANIKAELDDGAESHINESDNCSEGEATLLRTLDILKGTLQFWRVKRSSRLQAYEALMDVHVSLKRQLGIRHNLLDDVDITTGALEYLQMENGKLMEEKGRRISRAEDLLDKLRSICRELGEDCAGAAAEVHPALSSLSAEKESAEVLGSVYKLVGSPSHVTSGGDLDLSDGMFERLTIKINDMQRLKAEREAQSRDVLEMLGSLWDALSIPEDAPERNMVAKMLSVDRPQRLHKRTLDKCLAEVNRLEGCKAQAMRDLALTKARELEQLCISSRISPPHTGPLLAELDKPGQMTQVLSKLVRLVAEVQALASKRVPILLQVHELLQAQADSAWLRSYNQNENRYKGRDASRNMQRAIKAGKLRDRLQPMMESLLMALAEWELEEGGPFLYDEQVLQETQLRVVEAELEQLALEKVPKPKATVQPTATSGGGSSSAPASGRPPAASRSSLQRAASTATSTAGLPHHRTTSSTAGGAPATSVASSGSTTPRSVADAVRRMSLVAMPPPASARDSGVFRGGVMTATKGMMRSNDFGPGALRSLVTSSSGGAASDSVSCNAMHSGISAAATGQKTPPSRGVSAATPAAAVVSASPAATSALAASPSRLLIRGGGLGEDVDETTSTAATGSSIKNTAQDLFRRYLGDAQDLTIKLTPTKLVATSSPKPAMLSFSGSASGGGADDDGTDDVRATTCDTPKSTASSRSNSKPPSKQTQQTQQLCSAQSSAKSSRTPSVKSGTSTTSPPPEGTRSSRIPRVRM